MCFLSFGPVKEQTIHSYKNASFKTRSLHVGLSKRRNLHSQPAPLNADLISKFKVIRSKAVLNEKLKLSFLPINSITFITTLPVNKKARLPDFTGSVVLSS